MSPRYEVTPAGRAALAAPPLSASSCEVEGCVDGCCPSCRRIAWLESELAKRDQVVARLRAALGEFLMAKRTRRATG